MRNSLLSLFTVISLCSFAQNEHRWLIGGDVDFAGETSYGQFLYNISGSVVGGYFVYDGIFVGLEGSVSISAENRYYEPVPLLRYYYFFGEERHALYIGARGGYTWGELYSPFEDRWLGRNAWVYGGRFGYLSFLNNKIALDVFTFYDYRNRTSELSSGGYSDRQMTTSFGLGVGLQIFL